MLHEWKDDLIVVNRRDNGVFEAEIFLQIDTFSYLSIPPTERIYYRKRSISGETARDALDKAKDHIKGQLGLF